MKNWGTKKNVFFLGLLGGGFFVFFMYLTEGNSCYLSDWCRTNVWEFARSANLFLLSFPIISLLSLITYKLRDEIFSAWLTFAKWWILLTVALVLFAPATDSSLFPIDKGRISLFMNGFFLVISLSIICIKSWTVRK